MKALTTLNVMEDALIVGGVTVSLSMIQTVLGIVIMSVQVVLIIIKCVIKVREHLKNKNTKEAVEAIEDAQKEIDDRLNKK